MAALVFSLATTLVSSSSSSLVLSRISSAQRATHSFGVSKPLFVSRRLKSNLMAHTIARATLGLTQPTNLEIPKISFAGKDTDVVEWKGDILAVGVTENDLDKDQSSKFQNPILNKLDAHLKGLLAEASEEESHKAADDDEKSTSEKSIVLTATTVTHSESSEVEKIDCKGQSKIKKKHSKHRLTIIHFGTNVFLRASLGPRKKHMKKKHRSSKIKKDRANSDLGPSTSESRNLDKVKSHKKRKGDHKGQKDGNRSSDQVGRTAENGAVLASEFQAPKNTSLTTESSQTEAKAVETAIDGKGDSMQNCFMSVLTRGIEETMVAHWDDVNTTPSPTMESNTTITSIGHILDEWDEECDRGKRKKMRIPQHEYVAHWDDVNTTPSPTMESNTTITSIDHILDEWDEEYDRGIRKKIRIPQHEYGGPNLFQQVPSNKFKSKKVKLDRARSGNKPFRI